MRRTAFALLLLLPIPLLTSRARADEWYGWQSLIVDAGSLGLALVVRDGPGFGGVVFVLGAPVVHLAHGNAGTAMASLGLRTVLPAATYFALSRGDHMGRGAFFALASLGWGVLGYDMILARRATPVVQPLPEGGATFGIAGRF